jgi:hypothetical protein
MWVDAEISSSMEHRALWEKLFIHIYGSPYVWRPGPTELVGEMGAAYRSG